MRPSAADDTLPPNSDIPSHSDILVIGGGQAGLSAAYFLHRFGLGERYRVLDHAPGPGGAWQFRWPTLTLAGANHVHDLPGFGLIEALGVECDEYPAATAVPDYFTKYEARFGLRVHRPVHVRTVQRTTLFDGSEGFATTVQIGGAGQDGAEQGGAEQEGATTQRTITSRAIINATGTWDRPFIPYIPGAGDFRGRQLHTHDYIGPEEFSGKRVLVVGAGISAVQLLIEIARNAPGAETFWCSRTEPVFTDRPFSPEQGREAVARVERRVRAGLPPRSVVSVTGLARTPAIAAAERDGLMAWRPMFTRITENGVCWDYSAGNSGRRDNAEGGELNLDVIFWNTGFRSSLDHLAPLSLRGPGGGIVMTGRLTTAVAADPRIQLLGYGPSASTIGANRAGREAAREVIDILGAK